MADITDEEFERVYTNTFDPNGPFDHCPAVTTLLHKICKGDHVKFIEATELIKLFINTDRKLRT